MTFNLLVSGSPFSTLACLQALKFAQAAVDQGCDIRQVFFYQEAVLIANCMISTPRNETSIQQAWLDFAAATNTELSVCIAACIRRGMLNDAEAKRQEKGEQGNLMAGFSIRGLGEFVGACSESDKTLTFGS